MRHQALLNPIFTLRDPWKLEQRGAILLCERVVKNCVKLTERSRNRFLLLLLPLQKIWLGSMMSDEVSRKEAAAAAVAGAGAPEREKKEAAELPSG